MAHGIQVKILADSINPGRYRLTTFEITGFPKFLVAELNTHRLLSRNSASSRAVPVMTMCDRVEHNPYIPEVFQKNKKGMQPGTAIDLADIGEVRGIWMKAMEHALTHAKDMSRHELHKQWANRLIEPFLRTDIVLSGTEWANFLKLRYSDRVPNTGSVEPGSGTPMAQIEVWEVARQILRLLTKNQPTHVRYDEWHLPYIDQDDIRIVNSEASSLYSSELHDPSMMLAAISAARCARVSHFLRDGTKNIQDDLTLFQRLRTSGHWSPLEMPAKALSPNSYTGGDMSGNYGVHTRWCQLRKMFTEEHVQDMPKLLPEDDHD